MKNTSIKRLIACLLFVAILVPACKNRKGKRVKPDVVVLSMDSLDSVESASKLLDFTLEPWTYFSAKIDVDYTAENGKKLKPNASIRMYKDSLVWVSGGMFGIEAFRMLINKDSMVVINKLEKSYSVYKNQALKNFLDIPLSVTQIQNMILGKPLYALKLYSIIKKNESRISIQYSQNKIESTHSYNKQFFTIDTTLLKDVSSTQFAEVLYSSYSVFNKHNFPINTAINAGNGNKKIQIKLDYSGIDFETALSFPFTIPSSYEKI